MDQSNQRADCRQLWVGRLPRNSVAARRGLRSARIARGIKSAPFAKFAKDAAPGGWVTGKGGNPYLLPLLKDKLELDRRLSEATTNRDEKPWW
jgi:hypothetical protein